MSTFTSAALSMCSPSKGFHDIKITFSVSCVLCQGQEKLQESENAQVFFLMLMIERSMFCPFSKFRLSLNSY